MSKPKPETKICKHCQTEIPYKAKVCPQCRKKQGGKLKWIVIAVVVVLLLGGLLGGGDDESSSEPAKTETTEQKKEKKVEYTKVSAVELANALDKNPAKASKQYKDKYISVSGTLGNIDSDLAYFDIEGKDWDFTMIQCYIQNEEQEKIILDMEEGDKITVKGKCTDVGELMGYSIDVDSIKKK